MLIKELKRKKLFCQTQGSAVLFGLKDSPYLAIPNPHYDDADTDVDDVYDEPIVMMTTMMLMWRGYVGYAALIS